MTLDPEKLCVSLINADSENEVIELLKKAHLWEDRDCWRDFGDNDNNYSTAGAQQADPIAALVEKLVNSADARLMNGCQLAGIQPDSELAPPSVRHAVAQFIENSAAPGKENAQKITLAATGDKSDPCLTIVDLGEGQTPARVPETFMSLNKSNKLRIPFVQGKFNMGGTGVFRFCGQRSIQLVLTRRNPAILVSANKDDNFWSFSIVRRDAPTMGEKNSVYRYLAPVEVEGEQKRGVLRFPAETMKILPDGKIPYALAAGYGSLIKLYNYKYKGKSHILMKDGLLSAVGIRLPNPALPIMFHECRKYEGKEGSFNNPFTGLVVRMSDDRAGNLEDGFPYDESATIDGQPLLLRLYGFKSGKADTYRNKSEGVLFVVNGQTQGTLHSRFFKRNSIKFDYIADSLLLYIDCSKMERRAQEELFMNTRESLAESEFRFEIERQLEKIISKNEALREFNNRRRQEKIKDKIQDDKALENTLKNILKKSPALSALFLSGPRINDAFSTKSVATGENYAGSQFPNFFRFRNKSEGHVLLRNCEFGRGTRISLETDVENHYFGRSKEAGSYTVSCSSMAGEQIEIRNHDINLVNGIATLTIALPDHVTVGKQIQLEICVSDDSRLEPFVNRAILTVVPKSEASSVSQTRTKPPSNEVGEDRLAPSGLALPTAVWVYENEWEQHAFDKFSALKIQHSSEPNDSSTKDMNLAAYDFFINADNFYLLNELKRSTGNEATLQEQFKIGMILIGLALIYDSKDAAQGDALEETVDKMTRSVAMMLLPMINALGDLNFDGAEAEREAA
jgi:hypothetical protein